MVRLALHIALSMSNTLKYDDLINQTGNKLMTFSPEEIERRRQRIYITKPWEKSTGAKTDRGKEIVSQNALKTGRYSSFEPIRLLAKHLYEAQEMERIRVIAKKKREAYANSDAQPHPFWEQVFDGMSDDDFLRKLRNYEL